MTMMTTVIKIKKVEMVGSTSVKFTLICNGDDFDRVVILMMILGLTAQWSRTWGVGYFGVNFFLHFFYLFWTPFIYMGWKKMFRVHKITDYVVKIGCFIGL